MKRFLKMFTCSLVVFLFSIMPAFARELTFSELTHEIEKREGDGYAGYVYIIGKYVFTSQHTLTVPDIMTGARTIEVVDENGKTNQDDIYGEMTISYISRNQNGWKIEKPIIGSTQIAIDDDKMIDITYIDYDPIGEPTMYQVTFDSDNGQEKTVESVEEYHKATKPEDPTKDGYQFDGWYLGEEEYKFDTPVTENIELKAKWLKVIDTDKLVSSFAGAIQSEDYKTDYNQDKGLLTLDVLNSKANLLSITNTGLVAGIRNTLKTGDIKSITVTYNNVNYVFNDPSMKEGEDSEAYKKLKELLQALTGKTDLATATQGDLIDKSLTFTFELSDTSTLKEDCKKSYQIELVSTVSELEVNLTTEENNKTTDEFVGYKGNEDGLAIVTSDENPKTFTFTGKVKYYTDVYYEGRENGKQPVPGYYFSYVLKVPHAKEGVTVEVNGKKLTKKDFDTDDSIILVQKADKNGNKKITVKVDADGDGNLFKEETYELDYSQVEFLRESTFTVSPMDDQEEDFGYGWSEKEGYSTKVEAVEGENPTYKVTGVLPIFEDTDWEEDNPFEENQSDTYYLGLLLTLTDVPTPSTGDLTSTYTFKFFHDGEEDKDGVIKLVGSDFDRTNQIYVLVELTPFKYGVQKTFDIEIDLDGEGKEFSSYKVTVDWSELKFQDQSIGNVDFDLLKEDDLTEGSNEKKELDSYSYQASADKEVKIKQDSSQPDRDPSNIGIEGTIKEQTLKKGTFKEDKGYFVPIKIVAPQGEEFEEYKNSWTLILNTEEGTTKEYTPTKEEYEQGWVMVLFRLKEDGEKKIKYSIDFDGPYNAETNTGAVWLPYEYEISYESLTFESSHQVSFKGLEETITVWDGDTLTSDVLPKEEPKAEDAYHDFAYWTDDKGTKAEEIEITKETKDITLVPHWNLYSDKFISDVIDDLNSTEETSQSGDFSEKFIFERDPEDGSQITIRIIDPEVTLSEMNNTSIPGAIAYILLKDEIQEITLEVNTENKTTFVKGDNTDKDTLKEEIQTATKTLYEKILETAASGKPDTEVKLSELAEIEEYNQFTLKMNLDKVASSVTLAETPAVSGAMLMAVSAVPLEYTFNFEVDESIKAIKSEKALEEALKDNTVEEIVIAGDFQVEKKQTVSRNNVTITSAGNNNHTLTGKEGMDTIFDVTGTNVKIENLTLSGAQTGITVENGASVTAHDVTFSNMGTTSAARVSNEEEGSAVLVKAQGSFTGSNLTYSDEKYMKPLVKTENNATVKVTLEDGSEAKATTVEEVIPYDGQSQGTNNSIGDTKKAKDNYNYKHYYLSKDVANRWIKVTYIGNRAVTHAPLTYVLYHDKESGEEYLREPAKDINYLTIYSNGSATYAISKWVTFAGETYESGKIPVSSIKGNEASFSAELTATYKTHVKRVETEEELKNALQEEEITTIIVAKEIDLQEKLVIEKDNVIISGTESGSRVITGTLKGQIEVKGNKVVFSEIKIVGSGNEVTNGSVVKVMGTEFDSSEVEYSVESGTFDSILYYDVADPDSVLFYNTFNGNGKVSTYIEFSKEVDGNVEEGEEVSKNGSSLTGNYFADNGSAVTFIKMKNIKNNTRLNVRQTEVILNNASTKFLEFDAAPAGSNILLYFGSFWVKGQETATVYVNNGTQDDASGITLSIPASVVPKVKVEYTKEPEEGKKVIIKS